MAAPNPPQLNMLNLPEIEDELSQVLGYTQPACLPPAKQLGMLSLPWQPPNGLNDTGRGPHIGSKLILAHIAPLQRVDSAWDETLQLSPSSPMAAAQPASILLPLDGTKETDTQAAACPDTSHTTPILQANLRAPDRTQEPPADMLSMLSSLKIPQRATSQDPQAPPQPLTPPKHAVHPPTGAPRASASSKLIRLRAPTARGSTSLDAILSQTASADAHALSYAKRQPVQKHSSGLPAAPSWLQANPAAANHRGPTIPAGRSCIPSAIQSLSQVLPPGRHSPTRLHHRPYQQQQQMMQQSQPVSRVSVSNAGREFATAIPTLRSPGQTAIDTFAPSMAYPHPPARYLDPTATPTQTPRPIPTSPGRRQQQINQGQVTDLKASFAFDVVALHARQAQSPAPPSSPLRRPYSPYILNNASTPHRSQRSPDKWAARILQGSYSPVPPLAIVATAIPARRSYSSGRRYSPSLTQPRDWSSSAPSQSPPRRSGMSHARSKLLEQFCPSSPQLGSHAQGREIALQTTVSPQEQILAVPALKHGTKVLSENLSTSRMKPPPPPQDLNSSLLCEVLADKDQRAVSDSGGSSSSSLGMYLIKDGQLIQSPVWERPPNSQSSILHQLVVKAPWRPVPAPVYSSPTSPSRTRSSGSPSRGSPRTTLVWRPAAAPEDAAVMQIDRTSRSTGLCSAQGQQHSSSGGGLPGHLVETSQTSLAESPASQDSSSASSEDIQEEAESAGASALLGYLELKFSHTVKRRQLGRVLHAWRAHAASKRHPPSSSGPITAVAAATAALANISDSQRIASPSLESSQRSSSRSAGPVREGMPLQCKPNPQTTTLQTGQGLDYDSGNVFDSDVDNRDTYAGLYARLTQASAQPPEYSLAGVDSSTQQAESQQAKQHTSSAVRQLTFFGSSSNSSQGGDQGGELCSHSGPQNQRKQMTAVSVAEQPRSHGGVVEGVPPQWGYSREEGQTPGGIHTQAAGVVGGSSAIFHDLHAMIFDMEALLQRSGGSLYPTTDPSSLTMGQRFSQPAASREHLSQGQGNQTDGNAVAGGEHNGGHSNRAWTSESGPVHPVQQFSSQQPYSNQTPSGSGRVSGSGSLSSTPSKLWMQPQRITDLQYDKSLYASAAAHASSKLITGTTSDHTHALPVERAATTQWPPRPVNRSDPGIAVDVAPPQGQRGSGGSNRTTAPSPYAQSPSYAQSPPYATRGWNPGMDTYRNQNQHQYPQQRQPETVYAAQASGSKGGGSGSQNSWRGKELYYPPQPVYSDPGSVHDNPLLERIQRITASCMPPSPQTAPLPHGRSSSTSTPLSERQRSADSMDGLPPPPGRELSLAFPTSQNSIPALSNTLAVLRRTQDGDDGTYVNTSTPQSWFDYTAVAATAAAAPAVSHFHPLAAGAPAASQFSPMHQRPSPLHGAPVKFTGEVVNEAALLQELTELERELKSIGGVSDTNMQYFT